MGSDLLQTSQQESDRRPDENELRPARDFRDGDRQDERDQCRKQDRPSATVHRLGRLASDYPTQEDGGVSHLELPQKPTTPAIATVQRRSWEGTFVLRLHEGVE